jgi:hypothetical protein
VRYAFERKFGDNLELGAQLSVYKEGVPVVDLHGFAHNAQANYSAATLNNILSSGKNLEAMACILRFG